MQRLGDLLSSEEGLNRVRAMAEMLGIGGEDGPDLSAFSGLFKGGQYNASDEGGSYGGGGGSRESGRQPDFGDLGGLGDIFKNIDMGTVFKLFNAYRNTADGESERLLRALKPMLTDKRQGRVDEAIQMMKLIALLPLVMESGILGSLFGGKK